jgi:hypothetical protein
MQTSSILRVCVCVCVYIYMLPASGWWAHSLSKFKLMRRLRRRNHEWAEGWMRLEATFSIWILAQIVLASNSSEPHNAGGKRKTHSKFIEARRERETRGSFQISPHIDHTNHTQSTTTTPRIIIIWVRYEPSRCCQSGPARGHGSAPSAPPSASSFLFPSTPSLSLSHMKPQFGGKPEPLFNF